MERVLSFFNIVSGDSSINSASLLPETHRKSILLRLLAKKNTTQCSMSVNQVQLRRSTRKNSILRHVQRPWSNMNSTFFHRRKKRWNWNYKTFFYSIYRFPCKWITCTILQLIYSSLENKILLIPVYLKYYFFTFSSILSA